MALERAENLGMVLRVNNYVLNVRVPGRVRKTKIAIKGETAFILATFNSTVRPVVQIHI